MYGEGANVLVPRLRAAQTPTRRSTADEHVAD